MIDRFDLIINIRMFKLGYIYIILFLPVSRFYFYCISYRFSDSTNGFILLCLWFLCFYFLPVSCFPHDISFIHDSLDRIHVFKIKNRNKWYSFLWKKRK